MNISRRLLATASFLFVPLLMAQSGRPDPMHASVPMCKGNQMSLGTDAENGNFDGMSHSGTLLVLRNLGPGPCRIEAFPQITLLNGTTVLEATPTVPGAKFMHPGPVMLPVVVASGAEVTSSLRWVSGEVYSQNNCIKPTAIAVMINGEKQQTQFGGQLCGEAGKPLTYERTRLVTDPVYTGR